MTNLSPGLQQLAVLRSSDLLVNILAGQALQQKLSPFVHLSASLGQSGSDYLAVRMISLKCSFRTNPCKVQDRTVVVFFRHITEARSSPLANVDVLISQLSALRHLRQQLAAPELFALSSKMAARRYALILSPEKRQISAANRTTLPPCWL